MIIKLILRDHVLIKFIYRNRQVARESVLINSNAGRLVISATINPGRRWVEATKTRRVLESTIEYRLSNITPDIRVTREASDEKHWLFPSKIRQLLLLGAQCTPDLSYELRTISPVRARRGKQIWRCLFLRSSGISFSPSTSLTAREIRFSQA